MVIKASDFANMSLEEIAEIFPVEKCPNIQNKSLSRDYQLGEKHSCADCYFDAIDKEVLYHPIGIPRMHRKTGYSLLK